MRVEDAYEPDRSLIGKVRRRWVRLRRRRPARDVSDRPRLSLTFDDVPVSSATIGAEILEKRDAKGTFFISAGLLGADGPMGPYADWSHVERLHARGHEIGCHTFSHADLGQADGAAALKEVADNQTAFATHGLPSPDTFAYPYGDVSAGPKAVLATRFSLLRALHHGLIEQGADLNQAPSVGVEGPDAEQVALSWIRLAARRKAWLILTTHDIASRPSPWGCTPETLETLVDEALRLGFEIVTVAEGARLAA